jgi:dsRNA-specific ribonuclease
LGYLYLDIGEQEVFKFITKYLYPKIKEIRERPVKSYKTLVQEYIQRETKLTPLYQDYDAIIDDKKNVLQYKSELIVNEQVIAE